MLTPKRKENAKTKKTEKASRFVLAKKYKNQSKAKTK
jgi:hypothetical protein